MPTPGVPAHPMTPGALTPGALTPGAMTAAVLYAPRDLRIERRAPRHDWPGPGRQLLST
jgi:hypothetical protein